MLVLKRIGNYGTDNNLNLRLASHFSILTNPVMENCFNIEFMQHAEDKLILTISRILEEFKDAAPPVFQAQISDQMEKEVVKGREMVKIGIARSVKTGKLTSTATILEPVIQNVLRSTYIKAYGETGKGSSARQKVFPLNQFLQED